MGVIRAWRKIGHIRKTWAAHMEEEEETYDWEGLFSSKE